MSRSTTGRSEQEREAEVEARLRATRPADPGPEFWEAFTGRVMDALPAQEPATAEVHAFPWRRVGAAGGALLAAAAAALLVFLPAGNGTPPILQGEIEVREMLPGGWLGELEALDESALEALSSELDAALSTATQASLADTDPDALQQLVGEELQASVDVAAVARDLIEVGAGGGE